MKTDQGDGRIIPIAGRGRRMVPAPLAEVRAYWEGLREGRAVPLRSEIDPRGIERALEHTFILERIAPRMGRFRVAGMHLVDLMGTEVRGMPLGVLFAPGARDRLGETVEAVFSRPQIAELALVAETGFGRPPVEAALLLLPLRSDLGDINRAIGCLVATGSIGRTPRRFEISSVELAPATAAPGQAGNARPAPASAEPARRFPDKPELSLLQRAVHAMAEAPAPFRPRAAGSDAAQESAPEPSADAGQHGSRASARGHLRLVYGDRQD